jgi:competence protein ComEC
VAATALLAAAPPSRLDPLPPRVVFLDVGAGDAVVVQGRRATVLVDGGRAFPGGVDVGRSVVVPALRALGVAQLDLVVASHADLDHRGGLPAVLSQLPVERVWLPPGGATDPPFAPVVAAASRLGAVVEEPALGDPALQVGDLLLEVLWPPRVGTEHWSANDRSLVLRVSLAAGGGRRVLLTGDVEARAEAALVAGSASLAAEVLKLPHHGSRSSSTSALLSRVGAEIAVASAPRHGRLPLPHPAVLARVEAEGARVLWTGRDGAVLVALDAQARVRCFAVDPRE